MFDSKFRIFFLSFSSLRSVVYVLFLYNVLRLIHQISALSVRRG